MRNPCGGNILVAVDNILLAEGVVSSRGGYPPYGWGGGEP